MALYSRNLARLCLEAQFECEAEIRRRQRTVEKHVTMLSMRRCGTDFYRLTPSSIVRFGREVIPDRTCHALRKPCALARAGLRPQQRVGATRIEREGPEIATFYEKGTLFVFNQAELEAL